MASLHTWTGLLAGWLLYAIFLTGTVSYFRDEISQWMRPELAAPSQTQQAADMVQRVADTLGRTARDSAQWIISVPGERGNAAQAYWPGAKKFENGIFDPTSGQRITLRDTLGGDFFYSFHFNLYYMPIQVGRWIVGLLAMFMLVTILSGIITHKKIFVDFFTFRSGKGQRSWLDAHNAFSVLGLPFHLMITYTGLVTLALMYMPWGVKAGFPNEASRMAALSELSAYMPPGKPTGEAKPLVPLAGPVRTAEQRWGKGSIGNVLVNNPGDASARIVIARGEHARVSTSPQFLVFDGTDGRLLQSKDRVGAAAETRGVMYALHIGRFADLPVRGLYFLLGLAGTAMVGTGLVLWTVKRRQKLADPAHPHFGFRLVERLNVAAIAGLSIAMSGFLWANRLLPGELAGRAKWEINVFFILWALALLHALARPAKRAWIEQFLCAATLLLLLPLLDILSTHGMLFTRLRAGNALFLLFDLMFLVLGGLHIKLAWHTAHHRPAAPRAAAKGRK